MDYLMKKVLVICHGNINRSPLCAAELTRLGGLLIRSAGFVNPGTRAAKKMRDAAEANGLYLQTHRSTLITPEHLEWADKVIYMDGGNWKRLHSMLVGSEHPEVISLGHYAKPKVSTIPDPAFMAKTDPKFPKTVALILDATRRLHKELMK